VISLRLPRPRSNGPTDWKFQGPAPTIRLRLTVLYGLVFLITGAVLLTIGYLLVRHNIGGQPFRTRFRGITLPPALLPQFGSTPRDFALARQVHDQLVNDALHKLLVEYLFALGLMTMVSVGAGWLLAGRALRPLRDITATARRVSGENLGERISLSGPADELKELADTFDGMLGRLDAAFESQRRFVANASHELRTPLAIMRTEVDVALADSDASLDELRRMGEAVRETVDRCERLIESLLMLARSEAATGRDEPVDLAGLAGDCITDLMARSQDAEVRVQDDLAPAWVRGEPGLLERMIANLLDNGIRHNERGGFLRVCTRARTTGVELIVRNGGPRIEPGDARTLTEPFRRLDRSYGGFGLGLSIVRSVVEVHGGTTEIIAPDAGGLEVRVQLPALAGDLAPAVPVTSVLTKS
jgi:signal transduction histidine kinase